MEILITGANGLLGRHVVTMLQARGDDIVLTYREAGGTPGKVGIQYVAAVGRVTGSTWRIRGIAWEKILAR